MWAAAEEAAEAEGAREETVAKATEAALVAMRAAGMAVAARAQVAVAATVVVQEEAEAAAA